MGMVNDFTSVTQITPPTSVINNAQVLKSLTSVLECVENCLSELPEFNPRGPVINIEDPLSTTASQKFNQQQQQQQHVINPCHIFTSQANLHKLSKTKGVLAQFLACFCENDKMSENIKRIIEEPGLDEQDEEDESHAENEDEEEEKEEHSGSCCEESGSEAKPKQTSNDESDDEDVDENGDENASDNSNCSNNDNKRRRNDDDDNADGDDDVGCNKNGSNSPKKRAKLSNSQSQERDQHQHQQSMHNNIAKALSFVAGQMKEENNVEMIMFNEHSLKEKVETQHEKKSMQLFALLNTFQEIVLLFCRSWQVLLNGYDFGYLMKFVPRPGTKEEILFPKLEAFDNLALSRKVTQIHESMEQLPMHKLLQMASCIVSTVIG